MSVTWVACHVVVDSPALALFLFSRWSRDALRSISRSKLTTSHSVPGYNSPVSVKCVKGPPTPVPRPAPWKVIIVSSPAATGRAREFTRTREAGKAFTGTLVCVSLLLSVCLFRTFRMHRDVYSAASLAPLAVKADGNWHFARRATSIARRVLVSIISLEMDGGYVVTTASKGL